MAVVICGAGPEWSARTPLDRHAEGVLAELRRAAGALGVPVILLHHERVAAAPVVPPSGPVCEPLTAAADDLVVSAAGIDGFYGSNLDAVLRRRGLSHLLVGGRGFETTVHSTLRRANDRGYECLTVADASAALDPDCRAASISSIEMSGGIFGAVAPSTDVLPALSALSALIKEPT